MDFPNHNQEMRDTFPWGPSYDIDFEGVQAPITSFLPPHPTSVTVAMPPPPITESVNSDNIITEPWIQSATELANVTTGVVLPRKAGRRTRKGQQRINADEWIKHQNTIKRLYIDEDRSLEDTRAMILNESGFVASYVWTVNGGERVYADKTPRVKQYKDKLAEWNYFKYLPKPKALWMLNKAELRKLQEGKPQTVFTYGGRQWTIDRIEKNAKKRGAIPQNEALPFSPSFSL